MSGATSQRGPPSDEVQVSGGTVTASPVPWQSRGGIVPRSSPAPPTPPEPSVPHSSQESSEGSRWAVPGAAKSSIRPRWVATGPEPGPSAQSRSSIRRPNSAGTFTTSKAVPQGRTPGAVGRSSHWARVLRG
ncbi:hypothetical protein ADK33_26490 [Streptomyces griseus subsp. rhodochrous]|nr:hypothetical protein ADK33_26490 [Streptomyces griseus subsp. rhodochrous]